MTNETKDQLKLSAGTLIPLGSLLGILTIVFVAYSWLDARFDNINTSIRDVNYKLNSATEYRWNSNNEMTAWMEFAKLNKHGDGTAYNIPNVPKIIREGNQAKGNY